jgi:hypothetical protein
MKLAKLLNALLLVTSLFGYLEWGKGNFTFLYRAEWEVISKLLTDPVSVLHPFTVLPLLGQLVLFISLFVKKHLRLLTFVGLACIGILILFVLLVGVLALNWKIIVSTLPFLTTAVWVLKVNRRQPAPDR